MLLLVLDVSAAVPDHPANGRGVVNDDDGVRSRMELRDPL
jgi:hypothetical protein